MANIPFHRVNEDDFVEVPGSVPAVQVPLQQVGISNRPHYISVLDPFTNEPTRLYADMKLSLSLPVNERGLHMSRIERTLHTIASEAPRDLVAFATALVEKNREAQAQPFCRVELSAPYELVVDKNASGRPSHELLQLYVAAEYRDGAMHIEKGLSVQFMNACPCAQRWGIRRFAADLDAKGFSADQIQSIIADAPLQGHTQRGHATVRINSDEVTYPDLYATLEKTSPFVRELLSGADEHDFVREAQQRGMFSEDVAREIMLHVSQDFADKISDDTEVTIDVDVDESVHHHNLFASTKQTFGELKAVFKQ